MQLFLCIFTGFTCINDSLKVHIADVLSLIELSCQEMQLLLCRDICRLLSTHLQVKSAVEAFCQFGCFTRSEMFLGHIWNLLIACN